MLLNQLKLPLVTILWSGVHAHDSIKNRDKQLSNTRNCIIVRAELAIPL